MIAKFDISRIISQYRNIVIQCLVNSMFEYSFIYMLYIRNLYIRILLTLLSTCHY